MYVLDLGPPLEEQTTELLSNISPSIMKGEEEDGDHHLHLRKPVVSNTTLHIWSIKGKGSHNEKCKTDAYDDNHIHYHHRHYHYPHHIIIMI